MLSDDGYKNRLDADGVVCEGQESAELDGRRDMEAGGVSPTMSAFDQGDTRATVLAFHQTQDPISGDVSPALGVTSSGMGLLNVGVRRLTPRECERLQGFPDDWTEGQSDSARYKQMGNAVAVPCVEWVVKRLVEVDAA